MAKLWLGVDQIPSNTNPALATFIKKLHKVVGDGSVYLYFDDAYDYAKAVTKLQIKVTSDDVLKQIIDASALRDYKITKRGATHEYDTTALVKVNLHKSGGMRGTGRLPRLGESQATPSTAQQEKGTIAFFEGAFNGKPPTLKAISEQVGYPFDDQWMWNFRQQYAAFESNIGAIPKATIYLDSEKNDADVLNSIARRLGMTDNKDNWNPADMWIMTIPRSRVLSDTENMHTLAEYNAYLIEQYKKKKIIGVSLKKVDYKAVGKFAVVTTDNIPVVKLKPSRSLFDPYQTNFIFETAGTVRGFNIRVGYKAGTIKSDADIRIYLEGRMAGSGVQLGGVSSALFPSLAAENGFNIARDKAKIFADPQKYLAANLPRIFKHSVVVNKTSVAPKSEVQLRAAAFLTYYMRILLESDPALLSDCYYSSAKLNSFSSIHCKLS